MLNKKFEWLRSEPGPKLVLEGLKHIGLLEKPGAENNPVIVGWADEVARANPTAYSRWASGWYDKDSVPWCGLFMAMLAVRTADGRAERMPPEKYLSAVEWMKWGAPVSPNAAMLGDVAIFSRKGGGHVAVVIAQDGKYLYCLGGNQNDAVSIAGLDRKNVLGIRRPHYSKTPANVRQILITGGGPVSTSEA